MAHWAEIDNNSTVIRVLVTSSEEADEGYSWLIENLGGTWIKTSYNTYGGVHYLPDEIRDESGNRVPSGKPHLRYNFASIGSLYDPIKDAFIPLKPSEGEWVLNEETCLWEPIIESEV